MPKSRSLRDSISMGIGDAVDSVRGTYGRARARDAAREAASESAQASRPTVRGESNPVQEIGGTLRGMAPRALRERKQRIEQDLDDAGA